ncbi:Uncharacterised protein [Pragia fontium]|uniref:hypothetical protein n=1 Tax=Pragia fontium TaxID=82985 RepID=UPI000DFB0C56|nr:hypothetical protein [Pragia fontium]SUB83280.1 Uncharacterised protein [Pragia fontium]
MIRLINKLGIDKAIQYVIFGKAFSILSGVIIILLISNFLSQEAQGYYYTFNSVVALQIIFELGLSTVIIQFTSHEMANIEYDKNKKTIIGNEVSKKRFISLFRLALKWYGVIAILIIVFVGPLGYYFFSTESNSNVKWQYPWIILTIATAINVFLISVISIAEGCGLVVKVNKMRMYQALFAGILSAILIFNGNGLFATAAIAISGTVIFIIFSIKYFGHIFTISFFHFKNLDNEHRISWRKEILPMQWRIALSWISGYFIFFIMTPISFKFFGAEYAGKLGMSLTLCNMVMATGLAWISTKYPAWGLMISKGQRVELNKSFKISSIQSALFVIFSLFTACLFLFILQKLDVKFSERFLPILSFLFLVIAIIGNHIVACLATYIRAHKVEKMTLASCIMALLTICSMLLIAYSNNSTFYIPIYSFITWIYFVPQTFFIYRAFKRKYE